ncbi:MAG: hypothetical protein KDD82_31010 [Planctomycetes bacterium]|nr:hypothetical protein [Planctomycetota bacterium]
MSGAPLDPTNRVWGSSLRRPPEELRCARCFADVAGADAHSCQRCRAVYDRACLSVHRVCVACGGTHFARHVPPEPPVGMFRAMLAAIVRVIHGGPPP